MSRKKPPKNSQADHAVAFINNLTGTGDHSGKPFTLRRWQEPIVRELFGRLRPDGLRQYRKSLLALPRGNGKTDFAATILIYCLLGLPQHGQEIVSAAVSRKQSALIFQRAQQIIEADPYLSQLCEIIPSRHRIAVPHKYSFYQALSAESTRSSNLGLNPSVLLFDELQDQTGKMWAKLTTGLAKRSEPLTISLMTGGDNQQSVGHEEFEYAKKVQAGIVDDPTYLPVLYFADESEDWTDEKVWRKCNPALGDFLGVEALRQECKEAQQIPTREAAFRQYHLTAC